VFNISYLGYLSRRSPYWTVLLDRMAPKCHSLVHVSEIARTLGIRADGWGLRFGCDEDASTRIGKVEQVKETS
jgi:hypothetical protein